MYHVISDKITYLYTAKYNFGCHHIERSLQNAAFEISLFCAFSMQIGHYFDYSTTIKNKFRKKWGGLPEESYRSVNSSERIAPGSADLGQADCPSDDFNCPSHCTSCVLCSDPCFQWSWKFFFALWILTSFQWNLLLFLEELMSY